MYFRKYYDMQSVVNKYNQILGTPCMGGQFSQFPTDPQISIQQRIISQYHCVCKMVKNMDIMVKTVQKWQQGCGVGWWYPALQIGVGGWVKGEVISRYRNKLQINIKKVFEMIDTYKYQMLLTPQNKKPSTFNPGKETSYNHGKKRIGCYSYNLGDLIGSGYSSQVYKGRKNDNKETLYAIKVIKLATMSKGNYQLLQNEIKILKELEHPNIIKMHDVFYTENNCYIITDYCEGGTLQAHIDAGTDLDWRLIFGQLLEACQYLERKLIIHRDIKPANIFIKGHDWKIGDFGFARYVPHKTAQIREIYMIGSPLYMPPETLEKSIYSLKTDSFAFGVLFYHLITKQFPWSGNNKKQLLHDYANKPYPIQNIDFLPPYFQNFLKGLCQTQISQRSYITDFEQLKGTDSYFYQTTECSMFQENEDLIQVCTHDLNLDIVERMKLCKFVCFIHANIQHFPEMASISDSLLRMVKFLVEIFGWLENQTYSQYLDQFKCRTSLSLSKPQQFRQFHEQLLFHIDNLQGSLIRRCQILRIKMIQLLDIVRCILVRDFQNMKRSVPRLVLHPDFSKVLITAAQVNQIQGLKNIGF